MAAPSLSIYQNGLANVSGDQLNTFEQTCDNVAQLRTITGVPGLEIFIRGLTTPGDGGAGPFYWNVSSTALDNNLTIITPTGGSSSGRWVRLGYLTGFGAPFMAIRTVQTGTVDSATTSDGTVVWASTTAFAKTETIPAASGTFPGFMLIIKDYAQTAGTYNITIAPVTGTINGGANVAISTNGGIAWLQSDGVSNWVRII